MNVRYTFILCLTLLWMSFFIGCSHNSTKKNGVRQISDTDLSKSEHPLYYDSTCCVFEGYVMLEMSESSVVGNIKEVRYDRQRFFVKDQTERILVFDDCGNYLNAIGNRGRGAGEYYGIRSWNVDSYRQTVSIVDYDSRVKEYNYAGEYIKTLFPKADMTSTSFIGFYSSGKMIQRNALNWQNSPELSLFSEEMREVKTLMPQRGIQVDGIYSTMMRYMGLSDDTCFLMRDFCDTVYMLTDEMKSPVPYCVVEASRTVPANYKFKDRSMDEIRSELRAMPHLLSFTPLDDYFFFEYYDRSLLWNRRTNTGHLFQQAYRFDYKKPVCPGKIVGHYGNTLVGTVDESYVNNVLRQSDDFEEHPLYSTLNQLDEKSNPMLFLYRMVLN